MDDLIYKSTIEGLLWFDEPNSNLKHIKYALSYSIINFPSVKNWGWYKYDFAHLGFISFALIYCINYLFSQKQEKTKLQVGLEIIITCLMFLPLLLRVQNTNTAGIYSLITVIEISEYFKNKTKKSIIFIFIFIFIGYGLRFQMFLVCFILLLPILYFSIYSRAHAIETKSRFLFFNVLFVFITTIGCVELYQKTAPTKTTYDTWFDNHFKLIKIFDYGYSKYFRKTSNQDILNASGLSNNDLNLISKGLYWEKIDTIIPKVQISIGKITQRIPIKTRLRTVKDSILYLLSPRLISFSLLLIVVLFVSVKRNKQIFLPYVVSVSLIVLIVIYYGWIQRYYYTRLYFAPLISVLFFQLYRLNERGVSKFLLFVFFGLLSINSYSEIEAQHKLRKDAAKLTKLFYEANLEGKKFSNYGGIVNFELLSPPFPLDSKNFINNIKIQSPVKSIAEIGSGTTMLLLSDSNSLNELAIFYKEHYKKGFISTLINPKLGLYEVSTINILSTDKI